MNHHKALVLVVVATCSVLSSAPSEATPKNDRFTIKEVQHDGTDGVRGPGHGVALNDLGQVVGSVYDDDITYFFYTGPNGKGPIFTPPAIAAAGKHTARLTGINNAGQVSGSYQDCGVCTVEYAFVTSADDSSFTVFAPTGDTNSFAAAVDAQGRVAISGSTDTALFPRFTEGYRGIYGDTAVERLSGSGSLVITPKAIAGGIIVGATQNVVFGPSHAFRTQKDGVEIIDLGTFGGANSSAEAINKVGTVAGTAEDAAGVQHAFITDADGSLRRLDNDPAVARSQAYGIDAQGRVVGCYVPAGRGEMRAFVTEPNGGAMHDLNSLFHDPHAGLVLTCADAINAKGQILAHSDTDSHGPFLLTPTK